MTSEPFWLPIEAIVDLHKLQIAEHGGAPGLRDQSSLKSAMARSRQIFHYAKESPDIPSLAAAYAWGISKNHPFVDGNKLMALLSIAVFLELNGQYLDAREEGAYRIIMELADGSITETEFAGWVRENSLASTDF